MAPRAQTLGKAASPRIRRSQPRWGRIREINYSTNVGTRAWRSAHPKRIQKLSAWRYLHLLGKRTNPTNPHLPVRAYARAIGKKPSSNISLRRMVSGAKRFEQGKPINRSAFQKLLRTTRGVRRAIFGR